MSSTEARLKAFFERRLAPAAEELRRRGVSFFASGPEPETESWYLRVAADEPEFVEFDEQELAATLEQMWTDQELPELAELAGALVELSAELEPAEEDSADVSPFIYVMY